MTRHPRDPVVGSLFDGIGQPELERAAEILSGCPTIEVDAGEPYFRSSFDPGALLVVRDGFVVVRAKPAGTGRTVITCEAGAGRIVLRPAVDEILVGLVPSRLTTVSEAARERLLALPQVAGVLFAQIARTLALKQETIGNFGNTRHLERVRQKLLQLGRSYGRVGQGGIRIDFPVSHVVLAEMVGSSRETVTRAVDELQRSGFVSRRGHTYRLLVSPERLAWEV